MMSYARHNHMGSTRYKNVYTNHYLVCSIKITSKMKFSLACHLWASVVTCLSECSLFRLFLGFFFGFFSRLDNFTMIGLSLQGVLATLCIVHVHGALIQVVDLTHTVDESSIAWPGNPDFVFTKIFRGNNTEKGFW